MAAPARQDWFARAENPVSRTWLQQVAACAQNVQTHYTFWSSPHESMLLSFLAAGNTALLELKIFARPDICLRGTHLSMNALVLIALPGLKVPEFDAKEKQTLRSLEQRGSAPMVLWMCDAHILYHVLL